VGSFGLPTARISVTVGRYGQTSLKKPKKLKKAKKLPTLLSLCMISLSMCPCNRSRCRLSTYFFRRHWCRRALCDLRFSACGQRLSEVI